MVTDKDILKAIKTWVGNIFLKKDGDASETTIGEIKIPEGGLEIKINSFGRIYPSFIKGGKIKDQFTRIIAAFESLSKVASTGKYSDLTEKLTLTNSLLATVSGVSALDAAVGPVIDERTNLALRAVATKYRIDDPASKQVILDRIVEIFGASQIHIIPFAILLNTTSLGMPTGYYVGTLKDSNGRITGILVNNWRDNEKMIVNARIYDPNKFSIDVRVENYQSQIDAINSDLFSHGTSADPNLVQTNFATLNGWAANVQNVPPGFKNKTGILITVWRWRGDRSLSGDRQQTLIYKGCVAYREFFSGVWSDWIVSEGNQIT